MLLTKSRISVVAFAIISILLAFTLFRMVEPASADNAGGTIPGGFFGDTTGGNPPIGWNWQAQGQSMTLNLFLDPAWGNTVFGMEVFVAPVAGEAPVQTQYLGNFGSFPTGRTLCFIFTTSKQALPGTDVGIHLIGKTPVPLVISPAPINPGLLTAGAPCIEAEPEVTPTPTPTPTPIPTATPTPKPPVTGDFTPVSGVLMGLLLAGFVLITAGGTYLVQSRRAGS